MTVEPGTGAATLGWQAIKAVFGAYNAYADGRVRETDDGIRDDLRRRLGMIRSHLEHIEERAVERNSPEAVREVQRSVRVLDEFAEDLRSGPHGSSGVVHIDADPVKRKQINDLIKHDKVVYEKLVESTRHVNAALDAFVRQDDGAIGQLAELQQKLTGAKNHFQQRITLLGGL